jgi:hypothetical protein
VLAIIFYYTAEMTAFQGTGKSAMVNNMYVAYIPTFLLSDVQIKLQP